MAVPLALNFILPIKTGLNVISTGDNWLMFWATYLSACGSALVAIVSLKMNQNAIVQNNKMNDSVAWGRLVDRYNQLEKFIIEQERLHHPNWLKTDEYSKLFFIIEQERVPHQKWLKMDEYSELFFSKNPEINKKQRYFLLNRERQLLSSSKKIRRYLEAEYAYQISNRTSYILNSYGCCLRELNEAYLNLTKLLLSCYTSKEIDINRIINLQQIIKSSFENLELRGDEFLKVEKQRILDYAHEKNLEQGII